MFKSILFTPTVLLGVRVLLLCFTASLCLLRLKAANVAEGSFDFVTVKQKTLQDRMPTTVLKTCSTVKIFFESVFCILHFP